MTIKHYYVILSASEVSRLEGLSWVMQRSLWKEGRVRDSRATKKSF